MSGTRTDFFKFEVSSIGAIWFLPAMVWASIAVYCIIKYIPDSRLGHWIRIGVIAVLFFIGYGTAKITWLPFSIQSGLTAVVFMYGGYFIRLYLPKNLLQETWKTISAFVVACVIWFLDWYFGLETSMYIVTANFPHILLNIAGAFAAIYVIFVVVEITIKWKPLHGVYSYMNWMGKNTMIALCFHLLELKLIPCTSIFETIFPMLPTMLLVLIARLLWVTAWIFIVNKSKRFKWIFT